MAWKKTSHNRKNRVDRPMFFQGFFGVLWTRRIKNTTRSQKRRHKPLIKLNKNNQDFFYHICFFNKLKDLIISTFFNLIVLGNIITAILILFLTKLSKYKLRKDLLNLFLSTAVPKRLLTRKPRPTESGVFTLKYLYVMCGVLRASEDLKTEWKYCAGRENFN